MENFEQLFIVGAPRSGTTFLSTLFRDSKFGVPVESHFIPKYYSKLSQFGDLNNIDNFRKLVNAILTERPVMQWKLKVDADALFSEHTYPITYPAIINQIFSKRISRGAVNAWGDKTPGYILQLELLDEIFPNAKYIYIVRDGRDVALSLFQKNWGPSNIYTCAKYWHDLNADSEIITDLTQCNKLLNIKYEDLIDNGKELVPKICEFVGYSISSENIYQLIADTKNGNYFKWKNKLTEKQIRVFDSVAGETLKRYGYECLSSPGKVHIWKITLYKLHEKLSRFRFLFVHNVVDGIRIKYFKAQPFDQ